MVTLKHFIDLQNLPCLGKQEIPEAAAGHLSTSIDYPLQSWNFYRSHHLACLSQYCLEKVEQSIIT